MSTQPPTRIRANARGGFDVDLPEEERDLLVVLPSRMLSALEVLRDPEAIVPDELRRLFPPAYPTDASAENAYIRLVRDDLLEHHRDALSLLRDTAEVTHLDTKGVEAWLTALTDLRLMLGSMLDISESEVELDPSEPYYYNWICYHYLSQLQHEIVSVLTEQLPLPLTEEGDRLPEDPWGDPLGGLRWDGTPTPEPL